MDSRPLLKDVKIIMIHIDSKTFHELLDKGDRLAAAILRHYDSDHLAFVRSPLKTTQGELNGIREYEIILEGSEIKSIIIRREGSLVRLAFGYSMKDIEMVAREVYGKGTIDQGELDEIVRVFIQAVFSARAEGPSIYITGNRIILENRLWFESHFPGRTLNIMSVHEASIFLDLFFKHNGKYYASSKYSLNKGYWYLLSMRLKVPHYNEGDLMIGALGDRLTYALMALDEMGIQYYLGVNNDTLCNTLYHFNYLISLITGIFDNLALKTNAQLGINFSDLRRVSLSKRSGRGFLKEIAKKNSRIRTHIASYANFINLIYSFRERVIHREGLSKMILEHRGDIRRQSNFIKISGKQKNYIKQCGDTDSAFDPFTKWGVYEVGGQFLLEPYNFSMNAVSMLIAFVDRYLELLGYPSFIDAQKQKDDDFTRTLNFFEKHHLGY
jgi:hypothetical protein